MIPILSTSGRVFNLFSCFVCLRCIGVFSHLKLNARNLCIGLSTFSVFWQGRFKSCTLLVYERQSFEVIYAGKKTQHEFGFNNVGCIHLLIRTPGFCVFGNHEQKTAKVALKIRRHSPTDHASAMNGTPPRSQPQNYRSKSSERFRFRNFYKSYH